MSSVCHFHMFWSNRTLNVQGLGEILGKAMISHYLTVPINLELVHYICHNP